MWKLQERLDFTFLILCDDVLITPLDETAISSDYHDVDSLVPHAPGAASSGDIDILLTHPDFTSETEKQVQLSSSIGLKPDLSAVHYILSGFI